MLVSINRTKRLELIGQEIENSENKEYYILVKVQPIAREGGADGEISNQKVAIDNHLAYNVPKEFAQQVIELATKLHE